MKKNKLIGAFVLNVVAVVAVNVFFVSATEAGGYQEKASSVSGKCPRSVLSIERDNNRNNVHKKCDDDDHYANCEKMRAAAYVECLNRNSDRGGHANTKVRSDCFIESQAKFDACIGN